jgi:serine/threonine-protein kinase
MPEPAGNDPNGEPTFIAPRNDSAGSEAPQETVIPETHVSSPNGTTQIGNSDEMESFSDYETPDPLSQAVKLAQIGDHQILRILGRGGMGIVFKAHHRKLGRDVAVKMMLAGAHATADQSQRFMTEARAVAHLQHENIVQIFEVGEHDHMPYFSLELVDGQALDQLLKDQTFSERDAAALMQTLCIALQHAHDRGILHRDLKPANVLMTADGRPKVTDFGLARRVEEDTEESLKTKAGTIMGTPSYMSPEQARGNVDQLTPATDQYSLGATLYHMLTGRPPFMGARPLDTVMQVINNEPIAPRQLQPKLSVDIETICLKALQKDVDKRYASCAAMAEDLGRFLRGEPILARPVRRLERLWRWCRRNPVVASLSALAVSALIAVAAISTWSAITLRSKNAELTQRTERLQDFVQTMYDELRMFNVDETPRVKPARDRLLGSFNDIMLQVVEELPKEGNAEPVYAAVKMGLVESLIDQQKTEEAETILAELQTIFERRIKLKQGSDAARNNLVLLLMKTGNLKRDLRRDMATTLQLQQRALEIAQDIVDHPKAADDGKGRMPVYVTRTLLADTHTDLGGTWYRMGDPKKALEHMELALTLRQQALADFDADPKIAEWPAEDKAFERELLVEDLKFKKLNTGAALFRAGRSTEAEPLLKETYESSVEQMHADPHNPRFRHDFVGQAGLWAEFLGFTGRGSEALAVLEQSASQLEDLLADDPAGVSFRRTVTVALYRLSQWRKELKQGDAAVPLQECLSIRRTLAEKEPNNDRRQLDLMLALARSGQIAQAIKIAEIYRLREHPDVEMLIEIARSFSQASLFAADDRERTQNQNNALKTLKLAESLGYRDSVYLAGEPDFAPLRELPEFRSQIEMATRNP